MHACVSECEEATVTVNCAHERCAHHAAMHILDFELPYARGTITHPYLNRLSFNCTATLTHTHAFIQRCSACRTHRYVVNTEYSCGIDTQHVYMLVAQYAAVYTTVCRSI